MISIYKIHFGEDKIAKLSPYLFDGTISTTFSDETPILSKGKNYAQIFTKIYPFQILYFTFLIL